jgi:hypothetical protein
MENVEAVHGVPREDFLWRHAVVIQGQHQGIMTRDIIRTFLGKNDEIIVIVATYLEEGMTVDNLLSPFEKTMVDEGVLVYLFIKKPDETRSEFWRCNVFNQNLQRLSSYVGLVYARSLGIEYSLKIRSDMWFDRVNVLNYLQEQVKVPVIPYIKPEWAVGFKEAEKVKGRIAITGSATFNASEKQPYPYHIRDFWFYGHTEDLIRYFDMSVDTMPTFLAPESNLAIRWMNDMGLASATTLELTARYFVVVDPEDTQSQRVNTRKMPYDDYLVVRRYVPVQWWVLEEPERTITHREWLTEVCKLQGSEPEDEFLRRCSSGCPFHC